MRNSQQAVFWMGAVQVLGMVIAKTFQCRQKNHCQYKNICEKIACIESLKSRAQVSSVAPLAALGPPGDNHEWVKAKPVL
jgi:hypothetical protein